MKHLKYLTKVFYLELDFNLMKKFSHFLKYIKAGTGYITSSDLRSVLQVQKNLNFINVL